MNKLRYLSLLLLALLLPLSVNASQYVGSESCKGCHQEQFKDWQGSHHERAMDHASERSVRGDFNNVSVEFEGKKNRFFRKGKEYWVNIADAAGQFNDYKISFTFGYEPLQQYMVEFSDGRIQLIPFAWDTRPAQQGGQRWFYLHPEHSQPHHEFFWTNEGQNWNYMCADCHSTNVKKNFDVENNRYKTDYSEISVGCESCHGPGSDHLQKVASTSSDNLPSKSGGWGFSRNLTKAVDQWLLDKNMKTMSPAEIKNTDQVLTCAQCHSRHSQISDADHVATGNFGDRYRLTLIDQTHYYPDGQVYDEDYVYGSFLQSKMNANGVVCSNCHDPHTAKLTLPVEQVCTQCHQPQEYDVKAHHHHPEGSEGAQCVSCHMPETTYMQIDDRRDHRWHLPKPAVSQQLGTPDVCLSCHKDKDSDWSTKHTKVWSMGKVSNDDKPFAPVFAASNQGYREAASALSHIAQNKNHPDIIRASATARLASFGDTNTLIAVARSAKSPNELMRLSAAQGAVNLPVAERWRVMAPLLDDSVLAVRTEAVASLMPQWAEFSKEQQDKIQPVLDEYLEVQAFNADRGFSHVNRGNMLMYQGDFEGAKKAYLDGIRIEQGFDGAHLYLAELHRRLGDEPAARKRLATGQKLNPDNGEFSYRLGLSEIRDKRYGEAENYLKRATELNPENAHFHYVLGLALEKRVPQQAALSLAKAFQVSQNPQHLYALCEMVLRHGMLGGEGCLKDLSTVVPKNVIDGLRNQYPAR
ncbi:MAG: multiheme c-type cytochrome [Cellvibrionaceae bacterium]